MPCHGGGPNEIDVLTRIICILSDVIDVNDEAFVAKVSDAIINEQEKWCTKEDAIRHVLEHRNGERRHSFMSACWKLAEIEVPTGSEKTYTDDYGNSFRFVRRGKRGLLWTITDAVTGKEER